MQQKGKCRLGCDRDKTNNNKSECCELELKEFKSRRDWVG